MLNKALGKDQESAITEVKQKAQQLIIKKQMEPMILAESKNTVNIPSLRSQKSMEATST